MDTLPWILYGTAWKKQRTAELVEKAIQAGFRAIDTANQPKHYDEALVGQALREAVKKGISREDLFLQTKFTPTDGQDSRVPYDPAADLETQVMQSFESSLEHLGTTYIDSYILHGPYNYPGIGEEDKVVWKVFEKLYQSKRVRSIGISNVLRQHVEELCAWASVKPMMVQNRCYAQRGWDKDVREFCAQEKISYQGFSLLTANPEIVGHPLVAEIAENHHVESPQVVFRYSCDLGMICLTGTTDEMHMKQDLLSNGFKLSTEERVALDSLTRQSLATASARR